MKKIYLALIALTLGVSAQAQRSCDLAITGGLSTTTLTIDASGKTPSYVTLSIKNNGKDTVRLTDTVYFTSPFFGAGNFYLNPVKIDPAATINLKDTFFYTTGPAAGSYSFCDSVWIKGTAAAPVTDPVITNNKVCQTISVVYTKPASIDEAVKNEVVRTYPNPAANQLSFEFNSTSNDKLVAIIMDATGRTILTKEFVTAIGNGKFDMDINAIPSGMYILRLNAGDQSSTTKFNVQK